MSREDLGDIRNRLEVDEEIDLVGSPDGEGLWSDSQSLSRMSFFIEWLGSHIHLGDTWKFDNNDVAGVLCDYLDECELEPISVPQLPLSSFFLYVIFAIIVVGVLFISPLLSIFLITILFVMFSLEIFGIFRFWRLFFPSLGGYNIFGVGDFSKAHQVVVCASYDTTSCRGIFDSDKVQLELGGHLSHLKIPYSRIPFVMIFYFVIFFLFGTLWLKFLQVGGHWGVVFLSGLILLSMVFVEFLLRRDCREKSLKKDGKNEEIEERLASVATAIESVERLRKIELPFGIHLLLLGVSENGYGVDVFLRQHFDLLKAENTTFIFIEPLGGHSHKLHYVTREGVLFSKALSDKLLHSLDWTAARFSQFYPHVKMGMTSSWLVSSHGYDAVSLSSVLSDKKTKIRSEEKVEDDIHSVIEIEKLDRVAGFVVAFVQNLALEQEDS